ncbi:MAG: glycosyltransferase, partial [Verrucomicrobiota bacterium]
MRRERFSIVHTHTPKAGLLGQLAAKAAGGAIIVNTIHGFYFHEHMSCSARRFYIGLEKVSASCSDLILSQNLEDVQTALSEGICKPAQIRYLGNGIDVRMFDPSTVTASEEARLRSRFRIPAGAPVIGFVGRLAGIRKGFRDFLAAAKLLTKQFPAVRFLIVGEPDRGKPDALDEKAADHFGVAENCLFVGQISNIELPAVYKLM